MRHWDHPQHQPTFGDAQVIAEVFEGRKRPGSPRQGPRCWTSKLHPLDARTTPAWLQTALGKAALETGEFRLGRAFAPAGTGVAGVDEQAAWSSACLRPTRRESPIRCWRHRKRHVDRHARGRSSPGSCSIQRLERGWLAPKEKWAMGAIGHMGDDGSCLKLTPPVRAMAAARPAPARRLRTGVSAAIGTGVALMQLAGIAQKLEIQGAEDQGRAVRRTRSPRRGASPAARLEDRVVPDCGLDENGRREFSFGPRLFSLCPGRRPQGDGPRRERQARGDLPKPGAKDDAAMAEQAMADWKLMKSRSRRSPRSRPGARAGNGHGRRWKVDDFETSLVRTR